MPRTAVFLGPFLDKMSETGEMLKMLKLKNSQNFNISGEMLKMLKMLKFQGKSGGATPQKKGKQKTLFREKCLKQAKC